MKRIFLISFVCLILCGCATTTVNRGVVDNVLYSLIDPKLKVKISSDYRYIDKQKESKPWRTWGGELTPHIQTDRYFFDNKYDKKSIIIIIDKIMISFRSPLCFDPTPITINKKYLASGTVFFDKKEYSYIVFASDTHLVKLLHRAVNPRRKIQISIYYTADVGEKFESVDDLSDDQKQILSDFIKASEDDFTILHHFEAPELKDSDIYPKTIDENKDLDPNQIYRS